MAEVLTIRKLTAEQEAALAEAGVELKEKVDLRELDLNPPSHGETFLAEMEPDEAVIFVEMVRLTQELEGLQRGMLGDAFVALGSGIKGSNPRKALEEAINRDEFKMKFGGDEEEEAFFRKAQRRSFLHGLLHWRLGERLGMHAFRLGIRSPAVGSSALRVVRVSRRREQFHDG